MIYINVNTIKYHQLNHLYYKNYKTDIANKFGNAFYLDQERILHEKANTISVPSGLYGLEIKPGTFYYSGSSHPEIIDDKKGNLIISGTDLTKHSTDPRQNIFNIGPVNGFKNYDYDGEGEIDFDNLEEGYEAKWAQFLNESKDVDFNVIRDYIKYELKRGDEDDVALDAYIESLKRNFQADNARRAEYNDYEMDDYVEDFENYSLDKMDS